MSSAWETARCGLVKDESLFSSDSMSRCETENREHAMPHTCRTCSRLNPGDALYCYHDGTALDGHGRHDGPMQAGALPFRSPFVFPSGTSCRNFDDLVLACQQNWSSACEMLEQGYLERFLGGMGRADLALAAREAARSPD